MLDLPPACCRSVARWSSRCRGPSRRARRAPPLTPASTPGPSPSWVSPARCQLFNHHPCPPTLRARTVAGARGEPHRQHSLPGRSGSQRSCLAPGTARAKHPTLTLSPRCPGARRRRRLGHPPNHAGGCAGGGARRQRVGRVHPALSLLHDAVSTRHPLAPNPQPPYTMEVGAGRGSGCRWNGWVQCCHAEPAGHGRRHTARLQSLPCPPGLAAVPRRWQAFGAAFQYLAVRPWGRNLLLKYPGVFRRGRGGRVAGGWVGGGGGGGLHLKHATLLLGFVGRS